MIVRKAEVISHCDAHGTPQTIYSLDFQPNSTRLATCGGDALVKIWNMDCFTDAGDAKDALLATLTTHSKPVNIVRWSRDGKVLASGSDDNLVLIHRFSPGGYAHSTFGNNQANVKNKENWIRCCTLQGHTMDVLDLDWAPNGLLASASVDNLIMIWNIGQALCNSRAIISPYRILSGHYSFVKGIAFDPIGQYLVSCGADNLILVWNCEPVEGAVKCSPPGAVEWSVVKELSGPMQNIADKGMYRRIHWSADGQTVCVSACMKSGKPVGMVLKRDSWEAAMDLVGHGSLTASCRYCPYVLRILPDLPAPSPVPVHAAVAPAPAAAAAVPASPEAVEPGAPPKEPKKRRSYPLDDEEKRYSTSSADRSRRQAAKAELEAARTASIQSTESSQSDSQQLSTVESAEMAEPAAAAAVVVVSKASEVREPTIAAQAVPEPSQPLASEPAEEDVSLGLCTIVALGDQSGVVSLWASHDSKPLVVLRGLFDGAVTDIAWMRCGSAASGARHSRLLVACCSIDGHLALLDLPGERFAALPSRAMNEHCRSLYCEDQTEGRPAVATSEDLYGVQLTAFMPSSTAVAGSVLVGLSGHDLIAKQLETLTYTNSGRKRIKPVQITEELPPEARDNEAARSSSEASAGDEVAEWCWNGGALHRSATQAQPVAQGKSQITHYHSSSYKDSPQHNFRPNHTGSEGSKRLRFSDQHQYHLFHTGSDSQSSVTNGAAAAAAAVGGQRVVNDLTQLVRRKTPPSGTNGAASAPSLAPVVSAVPMAVVSAPVEVQSVNTLTIQYIESKTVCSVNLVDGSAAKQAVKGSNHVLCAEGTDLNTEVSLCERAKKLWSAEVSISVSALCGATLADGAGLAVVGCCDGSVYLLNMKDGEPFASALILGSPVAYCDVQSQSCGGFKVLAATALGDVFVWSVGIEVPFKLRLLLRTSLRSVLFSVECKLRVVQMGKKRKANADKEASEPSVVVRKCHLNERGLVTVTCCGTSSVADEEVFVFREDAQVWTEEEEEEVVDVYFMLGSLCLPLETFTEFHLVPFPSGEVVSSSHQTIYSHSNLVEWEKERY